nr:NUMOD4 domain-containing protein [Exiguobacterium indicum]
MQEQWKAVIGYIGIYEVSSLGRVRSLDRTIVTCRGVQQRRKGVLLRPRLNREGYRKVTLYQRGRGERVQVGLLVAQAFLTTDVTEAQLVRRNGKRADDQLSNLEVLPSIDQQYTELLGEFDLLLGQHVTLSPFQIRTIRAQYEKGKTTRQLAEQYQVTENRIRNIIDKKEAKFIS